MQEIVVPRDGRLVVWHPDGSIAWTADVPGGGRIWASPVVADFTGDSRREVVVASRQYVVMYDAAGAVAPGFPVTWRDEIRSLAAGDADADGRPEIVAVTTSALSAGGQRDIIQVIRGDGTVQPGFPPNTTGTAGCDDACYVTGACDQGVAVGPIDFHVPAYLAGLVDFPSTNVVVATNQVAVADFDPGVPGLDMVFAGFDGRIHRVGPDRTERWSYRYTTADDVLTAGVAIADLSGDGVPEIVFATYSPDAGVSALFILDAQGALQRQVSLPGRGAMPVPTVADVDGDGTLEIVVSLKDGEDHVRSALVYTVPGSSAGCLPWPTGRGNDLRNGFVR